MVRNRPGSSRPTDALQDGVLAQDVLMKGISDLKELCDIVLEKFETARDEFEAKAASS
jgi:hypothetical protein